MPFSVGMRVPHRGCAPERVAAGLLLAAGKILSSVHSQEKTCRWNTSSVGKRLLAFSEGPLKWSSATAGL